MADGNEDLADGMAVLSVWSGDSSCRQSPVSVASLRHAVSHLDSGARCHRTELGQCGHVHARKNRLEARRITDHAAQIAVGCSGNGSEERADHATGERLSACKSLTAAGQFGEDVGSQRGDRHWCRARRRNRYASRT